MFEIKSKEEAYNSDKYPFSFLYWHLVSLVSNAIVLVIIIFAWEKVFRNIYL